MRTPSKGPQAKASKMYETSSNRAFPHKFYHRRRRVGDRVAAAPVVEQKFATFGQFS